jgi:ferredoxin-NADP reductase/MOSC domain-containing protein YiiM/predicted pyridoxine 5'-phosphate oxidase superfamily flavin-nucleotide-binding protein
MPNDKSPFHRGEKEIQSRLGIQEKMEEKGRRVIRDHMPEQNLEFFAQLPLLMIGTVDACGRPWASVLAGKPGFVRAIDRRKLEVRARPIYGDPLNKALIEGADIGALGLEFGTRRRNRVNGKIGHLSEDAFEIRVSQSFPNCPQYIQARAHELSDDIENIGERRTVHRGEALNKAEAAMITRSDTLFIASQFSEDRGDWSHGVDVSHRGGRPGFVMVAHETLLLIPDYSGNCLFNTLGNIAVNPKCGLLFIDFDSGDTLQVTGEAEILWEPEHTQRFPRAERVLAFSVDETLHIERALPLTWAFQGYSPVFDKFQAVDIGGETVEAHAPMKLRSVNVSMPREVTHEGKIVTTGIFKEPVGGRVMLRQLNLDGDGQADLWGHGGAFRAVNVYSFENYAYWARELGRDDFTLGQFGENFTVEGMLEDDIHVGDIFRVGGALVEVSQPRVPCYKLAIKMGIEGFQNKFLASGRVGFYFRVLEEGEVGAGDVIELVKRDPRRMTVTEVSNLLYFDKENLEAARKALEIPALSHGWKGSFEKRLAKAETSAEVREGFRSFVVDRKEPESETITSFYLVPEDGAPLPEFLPGQFLTFELNIPGQPTPVIRTYSLSDSPNSDCYRVSIKRETAPADQPDLPPGLSSNYFHDQVEVGTKLRVGAPRGKFHLDPDSERPVVLLSGGVGLTPMISMMNAIVHSRSQRPVWFIHGARNGREQAMGAHVRRVAGENDNVHVHIRYSQPGPDDIEGRAYDSRGRVDIALLKQVLPFDDYDFFLCGPTPFMRSLYCGLLSLGVSEARIHYEFFGPASALKEEAKPVGKAPVPTAEAELAGGIEVTFARSGVTASWDPACESILDLAERRGLNPDYSCRSGICHTCMCELTEGEVEYLEEPLDKPDPGGVLICCSRPKTRVVIEV